MSTMTESEKKESHAPEPVEEAGAMNSYLVRHPQRIAGQSSDDKPGVENLSLWNI